MKTNIGLVNYCRNQLGLPYWYGTWGNFASASLLAQKKKQYPKYYTANDFEAQFGRRVHDCAGLIKAYRWLNEETGKIAYKASQDKGVTGMLADCSEKGDIKTIPEILGVLVFMNGHVGVYIGNGEVIEARGHAYGVVLTKLKDRPWTQWGKLNWLNYEEKKTMTKEEQIKHIQEKAGLDDNTMMYLQFYRYGDALIEKLANAMD